MLPLPFAFDKPTKITEAVAAVGEDGEGMFYSGGTELLLAMKMRVLHTERLVDIKGLPGLDLIALNDAKEMEIGARCTHKTVAAHALVRRHVPALSSLCANVANVRVRSVGTIGGNLCFGEPHADPPTMLAALDARLVLQGPNGQRAVGADHFIRSELETVREPDELLTKVIFALPTGPVTYRRFKHGERPSVNVGMAWSMADENTIAAARIRVGALGSRPQPLKAVEEALAGCAVGDARSTIGSVLAAALDELDVNDDRHGGADYKRHLAGVLLMRNAEEAMNRRESLP